MIKLYYSLTKPGIIYGNAITCIAGFLLASRGHINFLLLVETVVGLSLIIASACVTNNYIDRDIDRKMERTKNRALVTKKIPVVNALIFAFLLMTIGIYTLYFFTNFNSLSAAVFGFIIYVAAYGYTKRRTPNGTIVGSFAGAVPPVVGYCAASGNFDVVALILFLILVCWQMPHFYAIAIYRMKDYVNANIPVLPVIDGIFVTKIYMFFYIFAFIISCQLLTDIGVTGYIYLALITFVGIIWITYSILGFRAKDNIKWARKMFFISLIANLVLCVALSFGWAL